MLCYIRRIGSRKNLVHSETSYFSGPSYLYLILKYQHSKGRADLPQVLQFLMTTESGLPFWTTVRSGNLSDRELFPSAITSIQNHIQNIKQDLSVGFVAASALYSKKFLLHKNITCDWITRVPESIKLAKNLVERDHSQVSWQKLNEDYIGRNANIERCFRLMKDSSLKLNQIFLKRVDRIQALLTVMTLYLFVHNLGQLEVRNSLSKRNQKIPNQVGKDIANPSLKWIFL